MADKTKQWLVAVMMVSCAWTAAAAVFDSPARAQTRWRNHLDASLVTEIVESGGQLYCTSTGGLLSYDVGLDRFTQFTNLDGLTSNSLTSLAVASDGTFYVGTSDIGFVRLAVAGGSLNVVRSLTKEFDGLSDNSITSVAAWDDNIVYGSNNGMGLIVGGFPSSPRYKADGLPDDAVNDVSPWGDFVWIATDSGVVTLDRLGLINPVSGAPMQANVFANDGTTMFVGTNAGVQRFDPADSSWTSLGLAGFGINALYYDGQTMWATSASKLWEFEGASWALTRFDSITTRYGMNFAELSVPGLYVSSGGDAYVSMGQPSVARGVGLIRTDGSVSNVLAASSPGGSNLGRLSFDAVEGSLWASFFNFYVGKLMPDGTWLNYNESISAADSISARSTNLVCLADSRGDKWFGTLGSPLDRLTDQRDDTYANDRWEHLVTGAGGGAGLGTNQLQKAVEDPAGNIWFLSADPVRGIQIYNPFLDEWFEVSSTTVPSMLNGDVVDVALGNSVVYIGLRNVGVMKWNLVQYTWSEIQKAATHNWNLDMAIGNQLEGARVTSLALRSDLILWAGTEDGVFRWDQFQATKIGAFTGLAPGLLAPVVNDVVLDHDENLWVATPSGINRIARDDRNDILSFSTAAEYQRSLALLTYPLDVISPLVHENCLSLVVHPTEDVLFIGTQVGLSVFDFSAPSPTPSDLSKIYLYPNPVYGRKGHDSLKIANITDAVTVQVYNMEGELVGSADALQPGDVVWDLLTNDGFLATSGTYLVRVQAAHGSVVKMVAVIR